MEQVEYAETIEVCQTALDAVSVDDVAALIVRNHVNMIIKDLCRTRSTIQIPDRLWQALRGLDRTLLPCFLPPETNPFSCACLLFEIVALAVLDLQVGESLLVVQCVSGFVNHVAASLLGPNGTNIGLFSTRDEVKEERCVNRKLSRADPTRRNSTAWPLFTVDWSGIRTRRFDKIMVRGSVTPEQLGEWTECLNERGRLVAALRRGRNQNELVYVDFAETATETRPFPEDSFSIPQLRDPTHDEPEVRRAPTLLEYGIRSVAVSKDDTRAARRHFPGLLLDRRCFAWTNCELVLKLRRKVGKLFDFWTSRPRASHIPVFLDKVGKMMKLLPRLNNNIPKCHERSLAATLNRQVVDWRRDSLMHILMHTESRRLLIRRIHDRLHCRALMMTPESPYLRMVRHKIRDKYPNELYRLRNPGRCGTEGRPESPAQLITKLVARQASDVNLLYRLYHEENPNFNTALNNIRAVNGGSALDAAILSQELNTANEVRVAGPPRVLSLCCPVGARTTEVQDDRFLVWLTKSVLEDLKRDNCVFKLRGNTCGNAHFNCGRGTTTQLEYAIAEESRFDTEVFNREYERLNGQYGGDDDDSLASFLAERFLEDACDLVHRLKWIVDEIIMEHVTHEDDYHCYTKVMLEDVRPREIIHMIGMNVQGADVRKSKLVHMINRKTDPDIVLS